MLEKLSLEEKVGQMFMFGVNDRNTDAWNILLNILLIFFILHLLTYEVNINFTHKLITWFNHTYTIYMVTLIKIKPYLFTHYRYLTSITIIYCAHNLLLLTTNIRYTILCIYLYYLIKKKKRACVSALFFFGLFLTYDLLQMR